MSLGDLLRERGVRRALVVDDACDRTPKARDIVDAEEVWPIFNDDLTTDQRARIAQEFAPAAVTPFDELIQDDEYVATLWRLRGELGEVADKVFATYDANQASDIAYVAQAKARLEAVGLQCDTAGRDFQDAAQRADVILIDLFFGTAQDGTALGESKEALRRAVAPRTANPPLVILMSRSDRLLAKRDEFRDDVGLLDSGFRIVRKSDLESTDRLERQLGRLAENLDDTRRLAALFDAVERGLAGATDRTLRLLRKLKLSDIGQIQQLLLSAEGEPAGSYLVDVFDRVLQHEIEREAGIIEAAIGLNAFEAANHPPPFVAGSAELQELVDRMLTQNHERLALPGTEGSAVTFGDILRLSDRPAEQAPQHALVDDLTPDKVLLVLTPACDLQRGSAPRVLLLVGTVRNLSARDWSYGDDARTPAIRIGGELHWIKWDLKHIDTVSGDRLRAALGTGEINVVARLREAHALELQQRVLSGLGRVGLVAAMPATFPVELELYKAGVDGKPSLVPVAALTEGAVCWVGRDEDGNPRPRLVLTEGACDGIESALAQVAVAEIAERARPAFRHVTTTKDLQLALAAGLDLKGVKATGWSGLPSATGAAVSLPQMGLIAWNYTVPDAALQGKELSKAGLILLLRDVAAEGVTGLSDAIRAESGSQEDAPELEE